MHQPMPRTKRLLRDVAFAFAAAFVLPHATARAQVVVVNPPSVQIAPPTVTFSAAPPLVEVEPGVRVVEDYDEEVFVVNNQYWVRRDDHWFRASSWNGRWVYVEPRRVPSRIVRVAPGHYRHWKGGHGHPGKIKGKVVVAGPHGGAVVVKVKGGKGGKGGKHGGRGKHGR